MRKLVRASFIILCGFLFILTLIKTSNAACLICDSNDEGRCMENYYGPRTCYKYQFPTNNPYCKYGGTTFEDCDPGIN